MCSGAIVENSIPSRAEAVSEVVGILRAQAWTGLSKSLKKNTCKMCSRGTGWRAGRHAYLAGKEGSGRDGAAA